MDDDGLTNRNWGYYEPSEFRPNLGFQLIPSIIDRNHKPFLFSQNPANFITPNNDYCNGSSSNNNNNVIPFPRDYTDPPFMSSSWLNQHKDSKFFHNNTDAQPMQFLHIPKPEVVVDETRGPPPTKVKRDNNVLSVKRMRVPLRRSVEMVINGVSMDIGHLPVPVCSCTGMCQPCYRWGCGGWQSACCTTNVSMYPLPMSNKRRGARIAGRKMSQGAFRKVLEKLSGDGFDFSKPIDLKYHWAKHGTNKFVVIR